MKFYKLIKDILNTLRMEKAEFQRLTGINPVNITWWEQHPDTLPQMKTIKRIEQGLGIIFEFDEDGRPTGWQKSDGSIIPDSAPAPASHPKEKSSSAPVPVKMPMQTTYSGGSIPASPMELYDSLILYGDKMDWDELTSIDRKFYESLFQIFLLEIEEANSVYDRTIEQASLVRSHDIEEALQRSRRAMLNNLLGEIAINSELPI